ncbi:stalk domain-containing protein [Desulfotruncus alcoholivorax]|uniref:stalk domain-containing protein n=1 Tax=Desulfotruncus alcoholivorax TaxID=265477 RepID=UPI000422A784|nr:stalk domain-containing protein [Desulfotruncus alcoholivorax]
MKLAKLPAIISVLIILILGPGTARALKNQILPSDSPATIKPVTVFYDGIDITGQCIVSPSNGNTYILLQTIIDQLTDTKVQISAGASSCAITTGKNVINFSFDSPRVQVDGVELTLKNSPRLHNQTVYVPLEFVQNVLGCPVVDYAQLNTILIFSDPLIAGDASENNLITSKLQEYLTTDLYNLPKVKLELHKKFMETIHPDDIDLFCQNLLNAISTPTSWGAIDFIDSRVVTRTTDAAVVYYKVRYTDCSTGETIDGLWGLQKCNNNWYVRWNQ